MVIEAFILFLWAVVFLSDETVLSLRCFLFFFYFKIFCFSSSAFDPVCDIYFLQLFVLK